MIVSYDWSKRETYPQKDISVEEFYSNNLKIGDRVEFKYTFNLDGQISSHVNLVLSLIGEKGVVTGFNTYTSPSDYERVLEGLNVIVDFDNKELNEKIKKEKYCILPSQFVKLNNYGVKCNE